MRKPVIGVMGPGETADESICQRAYFLGEAIAERGWILLTGGRNVGVMEAASRGAKETGGFVLGILPDRDRRHASPSLDLAVFTDLGNARNNINILSCDAIIACGMGLGTASEIALALKNHTPTVLLGTGTTAERFFQGLSPQVTIAETLEEAIDAVEVVLEHR